MCYFIDSEIILANLVNNQKKEYTIKDLLNIKDSIEMEMSDIYIDLTKKSIFSTIEYYPHLFNWTGNSIKLVKDENLQDNYIELNFNRKLPIEIKDKIVNLVNA
jgi:hypothetical protein